MTALPKKRKFTPGEYLALEEKAETRSEYWNGEIVAMAGGNINHQQITTNLTVFLSNNLRGKCRVFPIEMKVWVKKTKQVFLS